MSSLLCCCQRLCDGDIAGIIAGVIVNAIAGVIAGVITGVSAGYGLTRFKLLTSSFSSYL